MTDNQATVHPENPSAQALEIDNEKAVIPAADGAAPKQEEEKETFDHPYEYWLASIGFAVGFGNVWRFPFMCFKMGGAAFLIPYCCSLFLIAVPMMTMETLYGQLIRMKLQHRYGSISQGWWGIAITQMCQCLFFTVYYITLMAWSFSYFFDSFKSPLPWMGGQVSKITDVKAKADAVAAKQKEAKQKIADTAAKALAAAIKAGKDKVTIENLKKASAVATAAINAKITGVSSKDLWNPDYFYKTTLNRSDSITDAGAPQGFLVFCLFLSYVYAYFSAWKGIKSTGKMVWVTCTLPYFILTVLLIKGLTLEGCGKGLEKLFIPDWSALADIEIWKNAAVQILFSSSVSFGPLIYYASARQDNEKIMKASFWIPVANSLTSLYAAITVFLFLGHVATMTGQTIDAVSESGMDLAFVAYPGLLGTLAGANIWAIIFFTMLVTLGVDSVFATVDFFQQMLLDMFPIIEQKIRKEFFCGILITFNFLFSLQFVTRGGFYNFIMFDNYSVALGLLFCLMFECIFFVYMLGIDRLEILAKERTNETVPKPVKWLAKFFVPVFTMCMIVFGIYSEIKAMATEQTPKKDGGGGKTAGEAGIEYVGRLLYIFPILAIPAGFLIKHKVNSPNVFDLIEQQHGIRFHNKSWKDNSYTKDGKEYDGLQE